MFNILCDYFPGKIIISALSTLLSARYCMFSLYYRYVNIKFHSNQKFFEIVTRLHASECMTRWLLKYVMSLYDSKDIRIAEYKSACVCICARTVSRSRIVARTLLHLHSCTYTCHCLSLLRIYIWIYLAYHCISLRVTVKSSQIKSACAK